MTYAQKSSAHMADIFELEGAPDAWLPLRSLHELRGMLNNLSNEALDELQRMREEMPI